MKGYSYTSPDRSDRVYDALSTWEELVVNAVGEVIDFWGFKRNHGRVWALLYMRNEPMSSNDIQQALELSKGAVSMMTRDLEQWDVLYRQRVTDSQSWHFTARLDFLSMIRKVIRERELEMVHRVRRDLQDAAHMARQEGADSAVVDRINRMDQLAALIVDALELFLGSGRIDVAEAEDLL